MMHSSYQKAFVLEFVTQMKDFSDPREILGLYVCHFLDDLQARGIDLQDEGCVDEYLEESGEELFKGNLFVPVLKKLMGLNLLRVKRERIFKHFSRLRLVGQANENDEFLRNEFSSGLLRSARNDVSGEGSKNKAVAASLPTQVVIASGAKQPSANNAFRRNADLFQPKFDLNEFIFETLQSYKTIKNPQKLKSIIRVFNEKLFSFLHSFEKEGEKFELRLFWPESSTPEVYDIGNLFEEEKYKKNREDDLYILEDENAVIKVRGEQLHEKICTLDFYGIERFTKKKKLDISLEERALLLSHAIEVVKKRYIYKEKPQLKIEFARLKIHSEKWRAICVESPSLSTVLALSLLINPEHSERLNYTGFIGRFS